MGLRSRSADHLAKRQYQASCKVNHEQRNRFRVHPQVEIHHLGHSIVPIFVVEGRVAIQIYDGLLSLSDRVVERKAENL